MPLDIRDAIIQEIEKIEGITVKNYLGELSDPQKPQIKDTEIPLVLIDYIGDDPASGQNEVKHMFNLYIVHVTLSANPKNRDINSKDVLTLLKSLDEAVSLTIKNEAIITLGRLRKIFDAASTKGYLSIYMRTVYATAQRQYHLTTNL